MKNQTQPARQTRSRKNLQREASKTLSAALFSAYGNSESGPTLLEASNTRTLPLHRRQAYEAFNGLFAGVSPVRCMQIFVEVSKDCNVSIAPLFAECECF